jgi:hypothetical protein
LTNMDFSMQGSQAGGEYPQFHCASGLPEAH